MPIDFKPGFLATGIGSLPHLDPRVAVDDVLARLPEMPYWPQLPAMGPSEDMGLQYAAPLMPLVAADPAGRRVIPNPELSREEALAAFYEKLFAGDLAGFGLGPADAAGFGLYLAKVAAMPAGTPPYLKGHVTGPLTMAASIKGRDGKAFLYDDEVAEAVARGLGLAAAAQVAQMNHLARPMMIFLDEPFLDGYGSAFTPISRARVVELLGFTLEEARNHAPDTVYGIHCCGNTDWSMLVDAGADVVNLDSAGYGEHLLLYPEALKALFDRGGAVAWGAVPTSQFSGRETAEGLWEHLRGLLAGLEAKGLSRERLASQALVTPACGMGSLTPEKARRILELTAGVSELARREYGR